MEALNPTVSIVVRTKDRPVLLQRAIASLAAQTYRPIEVVVVNDGGIALDEDRLRQSLADVDFRPITIPTSLGRAHAANVGLAAAGGSFVGFLDDDDELLPRHVTTLVMQSVLSGARVVYSDCETVVRELGPDGEILHEESEGRFFLSRDFSPEVLLFENYIPLICVLFSRQAVEGVGGFDETLDLFEDWDFYLRVAARHPFRRVPEITARYVQWSRTSQIAFSGSVDGRAAYLRVLAKNADRIVPQAVLAYYLAKQADAKSGAEWRRSLEREIARLAASLEQAERTIAGQTGEIAALGARMAERDAFISAVIGSLSWKLLHIYRTLVKTVLAPPGSRRRRTYDAVLGAVRHRTPTATRAPAHPAPALPAPPPPALPPQEIAPPAGTTRERFAAPVRATVETLPLMAVVSVVIPTLNAGPEFRAVLRRLRSQRGLLETEIVAIDSGSTDETLALCGEFGVAVAPYEGMTFNHGRARTQGVARTRGEYVVFMSQDAYPVGEEAVARMARFLAADPTLAVASGREVPRSDADLFSCWQLWYFNERILGYLADTAVGLDSQALAALSPEGRRKVAQVNNVFCCVRRSIFAEVGLRPLPFAEDLDLGLRVLQAGHRLAFMPTVAVVHSHRRSAAYHLKRLFVDWLAQVDLLGFEPQDWSQVGIETTAELVGDLTCFCRRLGAMLPVLDVSGSPEALEQRLRERLGAADADVETPGGTPVDRILGALAGALGGGDLPAPTQGRMICDRYLALVHEFLTFASGFRDLGHRTQDVRDSLFNLYGHLAGWCLADYVRFAEHASRRDPGAAVVTDVLAGGV